MRFVGVWITQCFQQLPRILPDPKQAQLGEGQLQGGLFREGMGPYRDHLKVRESNGPRYRPQTPLSWSNINLYLH